MIVWVCFVGGSGGDGFANLLEHASNARTIDGLDQWRIHRYVDNKVKFYAPNLQNSAVRCNTVNLLNDCQLEIANSDTEYLIITTHDTKFKTILSPTLLPDNKNIKILLISKNSDLSKYNFLIKNLKEFDKSDPTILKNLYKQDTTNLHAESVVDIDKVVDSWEYTKQFALSIGLALAQEDFDHYRKIVTGELMYDTPGIEYYKSVVDVDNIVGYSKLN
jgi:hypothetical protein